MKKTRKPVICHGSWIRRVAIALGLLCTFGCIRGVAASQCGKVLLAGEVNAGQVWQAKLGQGWVFRILPIQPTEASYSGWDMVVDRDAPAGYPDALLLATLPYSSINEREIGTTFGLRAQDAMGWNPRSFHFMTDPAAFREAQKVFGSLAAKGGLTGSGSTNRSEVMDRLLRLEKNTAAGELHIEDVRLVPGIADAAPFAQTWALAAMRTPHEMVAPADGKPSQRGSLLWMRFSVILWLPADWRLPPGLKGTPSPCVR